jgi:Ca2+-binding RTX toxin-like protein
MAGLPKGGPSRAISPSPRQAKTKHTLLKSEKESALRCSKHPEAASTETERHIYMDKTNLARKDAYLRGVVVVLAATLAALLVAFVAAKPSEAADPILTINPSSVDLGSVTVGAAPETQTITVTNTGSTSLVLGGVKLLGVDSGSFTTNIDPLTGLTVLAGDTATFEVSFDPVKTGLQNALLTLDTFNSVADLLAGNVSDVQVPAVSLTGQGVAVNNPGNCTITGSDRSETLRGTAGRDVICGLGGADKINGLKANDVLKGGNGNDRLTDKKGKDRLLGQRGRDTLNARDGNRGDLLKGGPRKDKAIKDKNDRARSI